MTSPVPSQIGKYLVKRELGHGAMGAVYEGFDPVIERLDRFVPIDLRHDYRLQIIVLQFEAMPDHFTFALHRGCIKTMDQQYHQQRQQ